MNTWKRRTVYYLFGLVALMFVYAEVYRFGAATFEGESKTFLESLQFVVETFTATGYGAESPWSSDPMNVMVILMDLTGVALIFIALPVLIFPLFEEAVSTSVPTAADGDLSDHVVVCTFTSRGETLIGELNSWGVPHLIVESDRDRARELYESGYDVIYNDPQSVDGLEAANLPGARALVADDSDRVNTSIVLTTQELAEHVRTVSVVEDPDNETYHRLAGTDVVLNPRSLVGGSLASKITTAVSSEFEDTVGVVEDVELAELPIDRESDLVGGTIAESGLREEAGVNVVGAWSEGEFESPPDPGTELDPGTVLLVTGRVDEIRKLRDVTRSSVRRRRQGTVVVAGYGEVGKSVVETLEAADVDHTVVDLEDGADVDVVGDVTDPEVLRGAGIGEARSVVFALPDDTLTEFATLVVRNENETVEILARAEDEENVPKVYRAGADYVLSLATVSGRMLASSVLEQEEVISTDGQVEVIRTTAPNLAGQTLAGADVRARTGCTVIAVERDGRTITDLEPAFEIREGDELVVAGTDDGINRFTELAS